MMLGTEDGPWIEGGGRLVLGRPLGNRVVLELMVRGSMLLLIRPRVAVMLCIAGLVVVLERG